MVLMFKKILDFFSKGNKNLTELEQLVSDAIITENSDVASAYSNVLDSFSFLQRSVDKKQIIFYREGKHIWDQSCLHKNYKESSDDEYIGASFEAMNRSNEYIVKGNLWIIQGIPCILEFDVMHSYKKVQDLKLKIIYPEN